MSGARLRGKTAIVTGATSGIGKRTAERLVEEGARVMLAGRRADQGESIARALGEAARFTTCDVECEADVARLVETTVREFGKIDILFNNAGGPAPAGAIAEIASEEFDRAVNVIFRSVFYGVKHVAPLMCAQKSGAIVSNASVAAHLGGYSTSHIYAALKAAIVQLTRSVALELAEHNVRANTVSPGAIATGIFGRGAGLAPEAADESAHRIALALRKAQPIARAGAPDDVASAVIFLVSDEASFITGRDLVIDGGMTAGRRFSEVMAGQAQMRDFLTRD